MSNDQDPSAARQWLRAELRAARERKGLTQQSVAYSLDWSLSKLLRIEAGSSGISATDLRAMISIYDISDEQLIHDFMDAARVGRRQPWWYGIPAGESGDLLRQEGDALGLLLDFSQFDRDVRDSWTLPAPGVPFLAGIGEASTLEDHLIIHDVDRFNDWVQSPLAQVAWRAFKKNGRTLYVMNANRTSVENTLGVDVIYYHEDERSFVLVQYKKLTRDARNGSSAAVYRPDAKLDDEIDRMESIDALCRDKDGPYRLLSTPCWFKLCEASHTMSDPSRLIQGMYLPLEYFVELRHTLKGPRGGAVLSWDNVPRYISNSMFVNLVQDGWIGSRGTGTREIATLVRESIATGHAVLVGIDSVATDGRSSSRPGQGLEP